MPSPRTTPRDLIAEIVTDGQTAAAGAMTATLAAAVGLRTHLGGLVVTGGGATGASVIEVATTGLATNLKFKVAVPAGAAVGVTPLVVTFPLPIPASADNTAITVTVPSFGAGNTAAAVSAFGYRA